MGIPALFGIGALELNFLRPMGNMVLGWLASRF